MSGSAVFAASLVAIATSFAGTLPTMLVVLSTTHTSSALLNVFVSRGMLVYTRDLGGAWLTLPILFDQLGFPRANDHFLHFSHTSHRRNLEAA